MFQCVSLLRAHRAQSATIATADEFCSAAPPAFAVDVTLGNGQSEVDISLYNRSKGNELCRRAFVVSGSHPLVLRAATQRRTLRWLVRGVYFQYYKHVLCFPAPASTACWRRPYYGVRKRGGPCNSLLVWIRQYQTPTFVCFIGNGYNVTAFQCTGTLLNEARVKWRLKRCWFDVLLSSLSSPAVSLVANWHFVFGGFGEKWQESKTPPLQGGACILMSILYLFSSLTRPHWVNGIGTLSIAHYRCHQTT